MFDEIDDNIDDVAEDGLCVRSGFSQYSAQLNQIPKLTEEQRRSYIQQQAHTERLWIDSLRLVLYVYSQLKKMGYMNYVTGVDMDIVQIGNLAALEAIPRWNPDKGRFSTFLVPRIRGAMLSEAADQARWSALTRSTPITQENAPDDDYGDWEGAPFDPQAAWEAAEDTIQSGAQNDTQLDDASYEAARGAELRTAISLLEDRLHNDIVMRYYQDNSIDRIAKLNGVSRQTIHTRIKQAIEILRSILLTDSEI